ncbi:pentatricopeptide repeat-containing protein [Tanacetum coccineum]|uniref:Pentatricopeptide repeat-containing protein n=1 Tax=Tanacetum coccineum TaxID=301880 RepID=A0ABQ5B3I6_9ASTR
MTACGRVFDIDLGSQIHGLVVKMGFEDDVFVMNALMGFYGKCGCLDLVVKVFDEMSVRDVSSWNTVVSCLVKEYMFGEALDMFREMVGTDGVGIGIDHFSVSAVLTACSEHGAVMEGREVHARAIKFGLERNLSVGNALIGFYSKCGNVKNVVSLFNRMVVKDVITWTQMISFYMESGLVDMVEEVFDKMPKRNCVSYNSLLSGFCQNGDWVRALPMFCRMLEEGVELDEYSLAIIMNACGLHEDKSASEQIHGFVLKFGFGSNDRVESALLDMCTKCGRLSDAEEMFISDSITQNSSIIWTSMICGYARNGDPYQALSLFFKGQSENIMIIDEMVLTTVLGLCATRV